MSALTLKHQKGVGLIEVLVTLLILSTALISLSALQTRSLQFNQGAYFRSQANIYGYDIIERMRVNLANIADYKVEAAPFDINSAPVTAPLAAADIDDWLRKIATTLPNGQGELDCDDGTKICVVTIVWDEINNSGQASEDKTTYSYSARL